MQGAEGGSPVLQAPALLPEPLEIRKLKVPASSPGVLGPAGVQAQGAQVREVQVPGVRPFAPGHFSVPVVQTGFGAPSLLSGVQSNGLPGQWDGSVVLQED